MKKRNDIFDQFREKGLHLSQPAPANGWRRLERKLEQRRRHEGGSMTKVWSMAAALAFLLVSAVVLTLQFRPSQEDTASGYMVEGSLPETAKARQEAIRLSQGVRGTAVSLPEGVSYKQLTLRTAGESANSSVDWFGWMEGQWGNLEGQMASEESWTKTEEGVWTGKALMDGKPVESYRISFDGTDPLFQLHLKPNSKPLTYRLASLANNQAVFTNEQIAFPQEVVVRKLGPDHCAIIYRNPAMTGLDKESIRFLGQRHRLQLQQVSRQLRRIRQEQI